jgi:thiamine-phosphate pyrophosphorylase
VIDGATALRVGVVGLRAAIDAGVDWLQLRDRSLDGGALLQAADCACEASRSASRAGRFIVNRRVDIAMAAGADGVHLGFDAMPASEARAWLGADASIGASLHEVEEVGSDPDLTHAHLAPVFDPLSKPSGRPALGLAALRKAATRGVPVLAQGGIDTTNARSVIVAGAVGVAVTGFLSSADDPGRAAAALRSALDA